jgi:hypothetical protein
MTDIDPSKIEEKILQNEGLVARILASAEHCSAPMTAAEFMDWLNTSLHDGQPAVETPKGDVKE